MTTLLLLACVLDRTGQSASASYERELALAQTRTEDLQARNANLAARVDQLEEVNRYRGQQEAVKMENLDQVRAEVQRLRGVVEELEHEAELAAEDDLALQEDVAFRLEYAETRLEALEKTLGLKPPPPPTQSPSTVIETGEIVLNDGEVVESELPTGPEELLSEAEAHMLANRPKIARVYYERFLRDFPSHEKAAEANYRLAETFYNEGDYKKAILHFEDVVTKHPTSQWAPWAMVRQGECFEMLGQRGNAELFWQDVIDRYPRTKAAKEAKTLLDS